MEVKRMHSLFEAGEFVQNRYDNQFSRCIFAKLHMSDLALK